MAAWSKRSRGAALLAVEVHAAVGEFRSAAEGCCGDAEHGAAVRLAESAESLAEAASKGRWWQVKGFRRCERRALLAEQEKKSKE